MAAKKQAAETAPATVPTAPVPAKAIKAPAPPVVTVKQLAATIADKQGRTIKEVNEIIAALTGEMVVQLKSGARLRISQIGILEVKLRPARSGRNPATGLAIDIPESKKIAFRAAKELKEAVM